MYLLVHCDIPTGVGSRGTGSRGLLGCSLGQWRCRGTRPPWPAQHPSLRPHLELDLVLEGHFLAVCLVGVVRVVATAVLLHFTELPLLLVVQLGRPTGA